MKKLFLLALLVAIADVACGAGFGLYEMDAKSTAMGGNVLGRPFGPSTIFYNPAGMSCLTGTCVYVGGTMLYPPIPYRVRGGGHESTDGRIDPGAYVFPTLFVTQQLPYGFTAGIGFYADFGLGSEYGSNWALKYDSVKTEFMGFTLNPALSYKITDKWSVAAGLRLTYATFETTQRRDFNLASIYGVPSGVGGLYNYGINNFNISADNMDDLAFGFNLGTRYQLTDDISVGVMYRSQMSTTLKGDTTWHGTVVGGRHRTGTEESIRLPQQLTVGFNWDNFLTQGLHFGASASWIGWSCMKKLAFDVYNPVTRQTGKQTLDMDWCDTIRTGFGFEYEINENWEALIGYAFDMDPSNDDLGKAHTMLPPGDRHVIAFGGAWHTADRRWEISLAYSPIIMQHSGASYHAEHGDQLRYMETTASCTHCVCLGLAYRF